MARVHVIGAGLAGLSAAVEAASTGHHVSLYESAAQAGGRCRSYFDSHLGQTIDNGNHLVLSGNTSVARYCARIGADGFHTMARARFPFMDLQSGQRWAIDINDGRFPAWVFSQARRALGTTARDYLPGIKMLFAGPDQVIAQTLNLGSRAYVRFWEPLILAVLNTPLDKAAATLMRPVFTETLMKGGAYCRPMIAHTTLAAALIDPALSYLASKGAQLHFSARVSALGTENGRVGHIDAGGDDIALGEDDAVIVAVPAWQADKLVPGLAAPLAGEGILNIHYAFETGAAEPDFLGLVGSLAQWVFVRPDMASVTVSAAGRAMAERPDELAVRCWQELCAAYGWDADNLPPYRVIKEKRATFDQSPAGIALRPPSRTKLSNLALAGDWTDTGLPATIEGAIRSGVTAAQVLCSQ